MERYWTLKYLEQNAISELTATVMKEGAAGSMLVRADTLPLVFPVLGAQSLPRGAQVRVKLGEIDEITLDISGTVLERLDDAQAVETDNESPEDEEDAVAGPIAIAVDVSDSEDAAAPKTD